MISTKDTKKLFKNVLRALPAIPFIMPRRRVSIIPIVLGAVGVAVISGIAAVMLFSPRTRYRALDIAKDGYGKVKGQIDHLGWATKHAVQGERTTSPEGFSNGLVGERGGSYSSTGM
jgi:hypothetical protein